MSARRPRRTEPARLEIERMDVELPFGFGRRADRILRAAISELARLPLAERIDADLKLHRIAVPPLRLVRGETDLMLARRIARAIAETIGVSRRAPGIRRADGASGASHAD